MKLTQIKPMKKAQAAIEFESRVSKTQKPVQNQQLSLSEVSKKPVAPIIKQDTKPQKITLDYLVRNNIINKTDKLYSEIEKGPNKGQKEYADIYYNETKDKYEISYDGKIYTNLTKLGNAQAEKLGKKTGVNGWKAIKLQSENRKLNAKKMNKIREIVKNTTIQELTKKESSNEYDSVEDDVDKTAKPKLTLQDNESKLIGKETEPIDNEEENDEEDGEDEEEMMKKMRKKKRKKTIHQKNKIMKQWIMVIQLTMKLKQQFTLSSFRRSRFQ